MSLIGDLISKALNALAPTFMRVYNHLRQAIDKIVHFQKTIQSIFGKVEQLISDVEDEVQQIENFQFDPKWKTRVISVPRAIDQIDQLIQVPGQIVDSIKDIVSLIKDKLNTPEEIEPDEMSKDLEDLGLKLGKGCEKVLGWLTLIVDAVLTIDQGLDDLNTIVDGIRQIREQIEHLDALFLPQGNTKILVDEHYRKRQRS